MARRGWHKYKAKRTVVNGVACPSKLHAQVFEMLHQLEMAGKIINLQMEVRVEPDKCEACGRFETEPVKVDFRYLDNESGEDVWVEAKGVELPRWKRFVKWWRKKGPGRLEVWKTGYRAPKLAEVVYPLEEP